MLPVKSFKRRSQYLVQTIVSSNTDFLISFAYFGRAKVQESSNAET